MTTPIPDEPLAKAYRPFQQDPRARDGETAPLEPALPPDLTVGEALSRWREAHGPRFEPLLAASELHGVMPKPRKRALH